MIRPFPTLALGLLVAGCAGQTVEGAWRGPFPLQSTHNCELRLRGNRTATVQCDGTNVVGGGHYSWNGEQLTVDLDVLTYFGKAVRKPEPFVFTIKGHGNSMTATERGKVYEWSRTLPNN